MSGQRKFKVGDKVRWYNSDGMPIWNARHLFCEHGDGFWIQGQVVSLRYDWFAVETDDPRFKPSQWKWPQPGGPQACYGEPGYLELVEAVEEPRFWVRDDGVTAYLMDNQGTFLFALHNMCRPEMEAICEKLNKAE